MTNANLEVYDQQGPLSVANECLSTWTRAPAEHDPRSQVFFGQVAWTLTGEAMP